MQCHRLLAMVCRRTLATNSERVLSALWGKLAAEILMQNWDAALDDLTRLKDIIDANTFAPLLQQLQQRTWLMHWALFVFFNHDNGRNAIIDLFFQDKCAAAHPVQVPQRVNTGKYKAQQACAASRICRHSVTRPPACTQCWPS